MEDFGKAPYVKNRPPLTGHGAAAVNAAITTQIGSLPEQVRRSLTWDQGGEIAHHTSSRSSPGSRSTPEIRTRPGGSPVTRAPTAVAPVPPQGHRSFPLGSERLDSYRNDPQQPAP
jgi:hypothetical protein